MTKYAFESFAPEFLDLIKDVDEEIFELLETVPESDESIKDHLEDMQMSLLADIGVATDLFVRALQSDMENLKAFIERYSADADDFYCYFENRPGFGHNTFTYIYLMSRPILYLCWKYFASIGDEKKANHSYFLLICVEGCCGLSDAWLPYIENNFDAVKGFIYADWQTVHPRITWQIGKYYLEKKEYAKARQFFNLGASLDYDGRQSIEPFIEVGKNKYELGMIYFEGLGVKKNYSKAKKYFEAAASDAGEPSLPVIGDMYFDGLGVKQDFEKALNCYCQYNSFNLDLNVYYKEMGEKQKQRLYFLLEKLGEIPNLTLDDLTFIWKTYEKRLGDQKKAEEWKKKAESMQ